MSFASDTQWLFRPQHLHQTPTTSAESKTVHNELLQRNHGVEFLFRVGLQLKLNVPVLATAATYFHRFYMRHSLDGHHVYDTAGACIFLACKIEESGRKLRDVAAVCHAKAAGVAVIVEDHDPNVAAWMKVVMSYEELLLEALCFDLTVEHPHTDLLMAVDVLNISEDLLAYAWSVINDSFRTPLCVLHPPRAIACACYLLCLHWTTPEVPLEHLTQGSEVSTVYEAFHLNSSQDAHLIPEIFALLLDFYNNIKAHVPEKLWRINPFAQTQYHALPVYSFAAISPETNGLHSDSQQETVNGSSAPSPIGNELSTNDMTPHRSPHEQPMED